MSLVFCPIFGFDHLLDTWCVLLLQNRQDRYWASWISRRCSHTDKSSGGKIEGTGFVTVRQFSQPSRSKLSHYLCLADPPSLRTQHRRCSWSEFEYTTTQTSGSFDHLILILKCLLAVLPNSGNFLSDVRAWAQQEDVGGSCCCDVVHNSVLQTVLPVLRLQHHRWSRRGR